MTVGQTLTAFRLDSRHQRMFVAPASFLSGVEQVITDAESSRPFGNAHRNSAKGEHRIAAFVSTLLDSRCPAAVFRRVVSVVVDPVNRLVRRCLSHVGEKVFKSHPPLADRDAASSVQFVLGGIRTTASGSHTAPDTVGSGGYSSCGVSVAQVCRARSFVHDASATGGMTTQKVTGLDDFFSFCGTLALARNHNGSLGCVPVFRPYRNPSPENRSDLNGFVFWSMLDGSHKNLLNRFDWLDQPRRTNGVADCILAVRHGRAIDFHTEVPQ